jgi:antirestriction protein ArdC
MGDCGAIRQPAIRKTRRLRRHFTGSETSTPTERTTPRPLHEFTLWMSHDSRLNRDLSSRFENETYPMEETRGRTRRSFLMRASFDHEYAAPWSCCWLEVLRWDKLRRAIHPLTQANRRTNIVPATSAKRGNLSVMIMYTYWHILA